MKAILIALLTLAVGFSQAQAEDHHHHHSSHGSETGKSVNPGKKFKPTEDLKVRMEKILNLTKELKDKKDDSKAVKKYGTEITATINDIFKTCKLEPEADAAIHPSLGLMLQGSKELEKGKYKAGYDKVHKALLDYEHLFEHEGWKH